MSKSSTMVSRRRRELKIKAVEYKGGKCSKCGYNKCINALQFHHVDRSTKEFGISSKGFSKSWDAIKKELDKCDILCSNCHAEEHSNEVEEIPYTRFSKESIYCSCCDKELKYKNKNNLCNTCYSITRRKVKNRPSKELLIEELKISNYTNIGKKYGVSDNTIRKWIK